MLAAGRRAMAECGGCGRRTSVTASTIFDWTRTPLTVWFHACWLFATAKDGISAQHLQRALEISSYPTPWAMLHRLRSALVRPGRDRLSGSGGGGRDVHRRGQPGCAAGGSAGKKVLTGIAVEVGEPKGIGRCRMAVLADASAESLHPFITGAVEPGSPRHHRRLEGLHGLAGLGYTHERRSQRAARARGDDPGELLPAVHRVASLAKRWLLGTHQGPGRRGSLCRLPGRVRLPLHPPPLGEPRPGLLPGHGAGRLHEPVRFRDLLAAKKPAPGPGSARLGTRAEPGPPRSEPAMEDRRASAAATDSLRLS